MILLAECKLKGTNYPFNRVFYSYYFRLTQHTKGSRLKAIKGMRPLPDFLPLNEIFDQSLLDFLSKHRIPIRKSFFDKMA